MTALQCCELLAKSQVFQKQASTSAEESKNRAKKKSHGIDHAGGGIPFRLWTATSHPVEIKGGQNFGERQPIRFGRPPRAAGLKIVRVSLAQRVSVYGIGGLLFAGISSCQLNWSATSSKITL